jgi:hypothetical protein
VAYPRRLARSWFPSRRAAVWFALGLLPLLFAQDVVHEGSHCAALELLGGTCSVWKPFIHRSEGVLAGGITDGDFAPEFLGIVCSVAPATALGLLAALRLAARRVRDERTGVLLRLWLFGASVDLVANSMASLSGDSDWGIMGRSFGLDETEFRAAIWLVRLAVAAALLTPWPQVASPQRVQIPAVTDFASVSALYGLLSAAAVGVSLLTHRPTFADDPEFWIVVSLQGVSAIACGALAMAGFSGRRTGARRGETYIAP